MDKMGSYQTLKSALDARVRIDKAQRLGSQRQDQGEGQLCPAGSGDLAQDVFGRPASQNTLSVNTSADCSHYTYTAQELMGFESNHRPYLPTCDAGLRGAGDAMGAGRDQMPKNLYGEGQRGDFVRHYPTANNAPWDEMPVVRHYSKSQYKRSPFNFSHDATSNRIYL